MTPLEFCSFHLPALERDQVRHNVMLASFAAIAEAKDILTWTLGAPGQCAIMWPGKPILLADIDETQCRALAEQTAQLDYVGVVGPDQTARWFAQRAVELGVKFREQIPQAICKPRQPL